MPASQDETAVAHRRRPLPVPGVLLLEGYAMYRLHGAAHRVRRHRAVTYRSRDDVWVVDAVSVAVESAIVHDGRLATDEHIGAGRDAEEDADAAAVALKRVPDERIAAGKRGE